MIYANPRALSLINFPEDDLLASNFTHLLQEGDRQRVEDRLAAVDARTQEMAQDPGVVINGKEISLSLLPVVTERHKTVMVILDDVSERKRMEADSCRPRKWRRSAPWAGGIADDFNNLLMVIQGNVSLTVLDLDANHRHYKMLMGIEKKVEAGSRLTSQLLGYARKGMYEIKADPLRTP